MIAVKKILVPIDFSPTSALALRYGQALAQAFHSSIHLLHVVEDPFTQPWAVESYGIPLANLAEEMDREAQQRLDSLLPDDDAGRLVVNRLTRIGHPFVEIIQYAKSERIDLIVMGTHGRGAVAHVLLGSVAERVVRQGPCPVLTVKDPQHQFIVP